MGMRRVSDAQRPSVHYVARQAPRRAIGAFRHHTYPKTPFAGRKARTPEKSGNGTVKIHELPASPAPKQTTFGRISYYAKIAAGLALGLLALDKLVPDFSKAQEMPKKRPGLLTSGIQKPTIETKGKRGYIEKGAKLFEDVYYENGALTFVRWDGVKNLTYKMMESPYHKELADAHLRMMWHANLKDTGRGVYLIYDYGIIFVAPIKVGEKSAVNLVDLTLSSEKNIIFTHEGAVKVCKNGEILASTPTTLLMITSGKDVETNWILNYKLMFGDIPDLVRPVFTQGSDENYAELRDPTFREGNAAAKIVIDLRTQDMEVVLDNDGTPAIGSR